MRLTTICTLSALATASILGCRSDSKNNTDGNTGGEGGGGSGVTIQQVQNDQMPPGTPVTLHGVVVTAIDNFGAKVGDIWVEEPEGGTFSGIHIFGAATTDVAAIAVGDLVDVTGAVKDEFALSGSNADPTGRTVTELKPASAGSLSVKKVGTGTLPAPVMVDALMIGQSTDADTQGPIFSGKWEPYEGVLVSVPNVAALSAPKSFGAANPDQSSFNITGVAKVESNMADITMSGIARNSCLNMTGVVDYFYDYLVLPRSSADIDTTATGCPPAETTCGDSVDNDGNGFADCADNNCMITDTSCRMDTNIAALDAATDANPASPTLPTGGLQLTGACVIKLSGTSSMYIAAAGLGANDGGIFAFGGGQMLPSGVAEGNLVDVIGTASMFGQKSSTAPEKQLEFNILQVTKKTGSCTPTPKPVTVDFATFATDAGSHPLIGSYVTLTAASAHNFKVTTANTATKNFGVFTQGTATASFGVSLIGGTLPILAANTCYDVLTGIWTYDTTGAGSYEIMLTAAPTAATCR